jgi:O-antigen/teichoic acid export membrane protein
MTGIFQRVRRLVGSAAMVYLASAALARGAALFLVPLYTRVLTLEEYGDYALAQTIAGTLPTFMSLGLPAAVARVFFDGQDKDAARARSAGIGRLVCLVTFVSGLVLEAFVLAFGSNEPGLTGRWELSCLLVAAVGSTLSGVPQSYLRAAQRPLAVACFQFLEFFALVASALVLVRGYGRGLRGTIEALGLGYGTAGIVALAFLLTLPSQTSRKGTRDALAFSVPFIPHFAANQAQLITDRWTMKLTGLEAQLGPYALAAQLCAPLALVTTAWNDATSPKVGELVREQGLRGLEASHRKIERSYAFVTAAAAGLLLCALPLAWLLVGDRFRGALWIVPLLCVVLVIESLYYPNVNVVYYASRTEMIPRITFAAAVLNVALNVLLILWLGVVGAVISRALAMTFRTFAMRFAGKRCLADTAPA